MNNVRFGVVGLGAMGMAHARTIADGKVARGELTAVCSSDAAKCEHFPAAAHFANVDKMINSRSIDALVIATPHLTHPTIGIAALEAGLHIMVEKPIAATKGDALRLLSIDRDPKQVFAVMFNMRTRPYLKKVREMIRGGELGEIRRVNWTATAFYRAQAYYADSSWRGTWTGEGGGVLLNQAPHHLDLLQWFLGMPSSLRGYCAFGKYHDIEVEDEAIAHMTFPNGATATFATSTGEAPGTTRIEIAAERGRLMIENEEAIFDRNEVPMSQFGREHTNPQAAPPVSRFRIDAAAKGGNYAEMFTNLADAILDGTPLISPAEEAINSLQLANAILLSSIQQRTITLPLDAAEYDAEFIKLVAGAK